MEITEVQMTATVYVEITKEDLDVIWACAESHYDLKVQQMTKQGGLLYGIKNHFSWPDVKDDKVNIHLNFDDLDTMAKALEQARRFLEPTLGTKGVYLNAKIHKMLRFMNKQFSSSPVKHNIEYEVTK